MGYSVALQPHTLQFRKPVGTSRGIYTLREVWYLHLRSSQYPTRVGIGECAPLPGLSKELTPQFPQKLIELCQSIEGKETLDINSFRAYPSFIFAIETALQHLKQGSFALWDSPFARGETGIKINGLIWMGEKREMLRQIKDKLEQGYSCIKLKIGAINFEDELDLLRYIRSHFSPQEIEIRVDANGAFSPDNVRQRLEQLSRYSLHSIEQPIQTKQWELLAHLCATSPLPIALDEELIGHNTIEEKRELLHRISPQFIVLKPSLHGGFSGCDEWVQLASDKNIGWWATSALESNIGLNAISHWCFSQKALVPQGLGTGLLFTENIPLPLSIIGDKLWYNRRTQQGS